MKLIQLVIICMASFNICHAEVHLTSFEAAALESFFRLVCEKYEAGYVLEGTKPVCDLGYREDAGIDITSPFSLNSAILKEGIKVWDDKIELNKKEGNFLLIHKNIPQKDYSEHVAIAFVNKKLLSEIFRNHLPIYQVFLDPLLTEEKLMTEFINKKKSAFFGGNKQNNLLVGITLGYGLKNALCVSRLEELEDNVFSEETPPFKNLREVLNFPHLNVLDYICQRNHAKKARLLQPNLGYSTIQEEYQELIKNIRLSPEPLCSEHPRFIFGYFKDDPVSLVLIEKLKESQKEIQKQLQTESFLKDCVRDFAGIEIIIDQDDSLAKALTAISKDQWNHLVSKRLCYTLMEEGYSLDDQQAFLEGFRETNATRELLDFRCAWPHFSENLQRALNNLKEANLFFSRLRNQAHLKELIPNSLFIESSENEADQKNDRASKVLLDYVVYNPKEEVLREVKGEAVLLSDTIPGFSQGVRQMRVGETARLYIHPSLAYGVETVSEQGIYLIADVTLRKVEEFLKDSAPLPIPKNLSYFLDPDWLSQSMEKRRLAMKDRGKELRCFFKKSPLLNMEEIESQMRMHLSDVSREVRITEREKELLNRLYWSICTKN